MRIPEATSGSVAFKDAEPERATAGPKADRVSLSEPFLSGSYLWATDSYVAVRLPVDREETDTDGQVPAAALKAARKVRLPEYRAIGLPNGSATVADPMMGTASFRREHDYVPPNLAALMPEAGTDNAVCVDVEYLYRTARAMGAREVRLSFRTAEDGTIDPLKPVILEPAREQDGRLGLVMPIRPPVS